MAQGKRRSWRLVSILTAGLTVTLFAGGCPLLPGDGDDGSSTTGTLSGNVLNTMTNGGVANVAVALSPAVDGVNITTDANGAFQAELAPGLYTLSVADDKYSQASQQAVIQPGLTSNVELEITPNSAVVVNAAVTGDATPGATVAATVTVEVFDGSTVQSYSWTQGNSVEITIESPTAAATDVTLPDLAAYKEELLKVLAEPPISEADLPPNVTIPETAEGEFPGGLQNRFYVVGLNPFNLEHAGMVVLDVEVKTSSGTYTGEVEVITELPWKWTTGVQNVPIGLPVLLQGKEQDSYDWSLSRPAGSSAALTDAKTRNPYFTPDESGLYTVTVTDMTVDPEVEVELEIYAGTWEGAISGITGTGVPQSEDCTVCHGPPLNLAENVFEPWSQTGHAMIFADNLNTSTHYGESCFPCHTVGFDKDVDNGGFDDDRDYQAFLDAGLINNPSDDNWETVASDYEGLAQLANAQCENCHGPQKGGAHTQGAVRVSLASDVCAYCHGEPLRHGRHQQWQLSRHANYETAIAEGESGNCARCHTVNGFLKWVDVMLDDDPETDPGDNVTVDWETDGTHPVTCVACHDPHQIGTQSGDATDAILRIEGDTPPLAAGFTVFGAGRGAICMTCHNSRRGLRNDAVFVDGADESRSPHGSAQTDVVMGQNAYFVSIGARGAHGWIEDSCVACHMVATPPPDTLSYNQSGTNHTFYAGTDICIECHEEIIDASAIQPAFESAAEELQDLIEEAILAVMEDQIDAGNKIDLAGEETITDIDDISSIEFTESHGRQGIIVTFADKSVTEALSLGDVLVLDGGNNELGELYDFADNRLVKAGWNYILVHSDGSEGVHNPTFVFDVLEMSILQLNILLDE